MIHSVIEDGNNNMWVGTSSGISKLEIQNGEVVRITSYDKLDNLPSESFVNNRVARLPDGTIVMRGEGLRGENMDPVIGSYVK